MTKIWKVYKKIFISTLIVSLSCNPLLLASSLAVEEIYTPSATIETGDAIAITESQVEVNSLEINSQVDTVLIPVASDSGSAIAPFPLPSPSPTETVATEAAVNADQITDTTLEIENQADVDTTSEATATTGDNTQTTTADATISTGDATSIATSLTLANTTLIDSTLQIGVIAILESWDGDIVLDPMTQQPLGDYDNLLQSLNLTNSNTTVESNTTATANTGDNTQIGPDATMLTGDAMAIAESNVMVNTTLIDADIFTLLTENLWLWSGNIHNWEYPGSVQGASSISNASSIASVGCDGSCSMAMTIDNQAEVLTTTSATASTGGNTQDSSGSSSMATGDATALAVSTTMVNTTLVNSRYRQLSLALFAPWTGNLVFAYPDLLVSVQGPSEVMEGDDITYVLTVKNNGYGVASNIDLNTQIQNAQRVLYDKSEIKDTLGSGEVLVTNITFPSTGYGGETLSLSTLAKNDTPEESMVNNSANVTTKVLPRESTGTTNVSTTQSAETPKLRLTSENNVGEYVYAGDGVTYDIVAYNDGPIDAHNVVLYQRFYSPDGDLISEFSGKVGSISVNAKKSIRFVLGTGAGLPEGRYYTRSYVHGESSVGQGTDSNTVENPIPLRLRGIDLASAEHAQGSVMSVAAEEAQILGASSMQSCQKCLSIPWYIAISIGSIGYYLMCSRRRDYADAIKWGLALPIAAYAGLIFSNPDCASDITMLPSSGAACIWFLPLAMLIYLTVMSGGKIGQNIVVYFRQRNLGISR